MSRRYRPIVTTILYSIIDAAELLGVSRWTIMRMMDACELPTIQVGGSRKILRSDLDTWIESQRAASLAAIAARKGAVNLAPKRRGRPRKQALAT